MKFDEFDCDCDRCRFPQHPEAKLFRGEVSPREFLEWVDTGQDPEVDRGAVQEFMEDWIANERAYGRPGVVESPILRAARLAGDWWGQWTPLATPPSLVESHWRDSEE